MTLFDNERSNRQIVDTEAGTDRGENMRHGPANPTKNLFPRNLQETDDSSHASMFVLFASVYG